MRIWELLLLAIGLSMDAFAVSVCKGMSMKKMLWKNAFKSGLYFGFFQAAMPLIGYYFGTHFQSAIVNIDHWIAFFLLGLIGLHMIKESFEKETKPEEINDSFSFQIMILLAVATSIDALAVGITFAFLKVTILPAVIFIGCITFFCSILGVKIGNSFGIRFKSRAEFTGGIILFLIGIKILLEHLGYLRF